MKALINTYAVYDRAGIRLGEIAVPDTDRAAMREALEQWWWLSRRGWQIAREDGVVMDIVDGRITEMGRLEFISQVER